jgi:hypothetical protein
VTVRPAAARGRGAGKAGPEDCRKARQAGAITSGIGEAFFCHFALDAFREENACCIYITLYAWARDMTKPPARQQKNYRLAPGIIRVLRDTARATGWSQTQVLEVCVARHALSLPAVSARTRREIVRLVAAHLGQDRGKKEVSPARRGAPKGASKGGVHAFFLL